MTKYVITGGPGIGKTTTLLGLQKLGYNIVPEAARAIIEEEQEKKAGILPWTDLAWFQERVVARQLVLERAIKQFPAFCDRGLFDNIAYCREGNLNLPPELEENISRSRYTTIFILEPLPVYQQDTQRKENQEKAGKLHRLIEQAYQDLGYDIFPVPVLVPEERVRLILSKVL